MAGSILDYLGEPQWAVRIEEKLEKIMATIAEALQGWRDYTDALKSRISELESSLTAANDTMQELIATDAAEDAAIVTDLTNQIAQQISDALAAAQNPVEPPPVVEEPVESPTPEVVEAPVSEDVPSGKAG